MRGRACQTRAAAAGTVLTPRVIGEEPLDGRPTWTALMMVLRAELASLAWSSSNLLQPPLPAPTPPPLCGPPEIPRSPLPSSTVLLLSRSRWCRPRPSIRLIPWNSFNFSVQSWKPMAKKY